MKRLVIFAVLILSFFIPVYAETDRELPSETGKIMSIEYDDNSDISNQTNVVKQIVKVKILSGKYKGYEKYTENILTGNPAYDINLKKGDRVILHVESNSPDIISIDNLNFYIADVKRDNVLWLTCGLFCLLLVIIGRRKGAFSLLSIISTALLIFFGLVPMILHGVQPIFATVVIGILSTVITIYLVGGFNSKSTAAILGTVLSLIIAGIFSALTIYFAGLTGFNGEENVFLYTSHPELNFKGILASSMIIAALGALMDTAVSIASTINEIHQTDSSLSVTQLFRSGMNVGRDIIGTMSNTLILVYMGSSLSLVLLSSNIDFQKFFNLNQVATEISSAIIGSIAILICVPLTAWIAALMVKNKKEDIQFEIKN